MNKFATNPLYLQVRDDLASRIAAQQWLVHTALPNESELAREMGVSPGTMRRALDMLESDGLLTRKQGRGTFITDPQSPAIASKYNNIRSATGERLNGDIEVLSVVEGAATDMERSRLVLEPGAEVCRVERRRSHMRLSYMFETVTLPASVFPRLVQRGLASSRLTKIASAYGLLVGDSDETVRSRVASPVAMKALEIAEGTPVLVLDRIIKGRNGEPMQWRVAECPMAGDLKYVVES